MASKIEVCGGFDGSENDDWTAIRLETYEGFQFTPTYGPDSRPTYWDPHEWGGHIPRDEVDVAWKEISDRFKIKRVYLDPPYWKSDIERWMEKYGDEVFVMWPTYRTQASYDALVRYRSDLRTKQVKSDACEATALHMANARKIAKPSDRYLIGKPSQHQKIDLAMTSVLAHEAACDMRADGWMETNKSVFVLR